MSNRNTTRPDGPASGSAKASVTRILPFPWPEEQRGEAESQAVQALRAGSVMAYPTETAYALGGNALLPQVTDAVYRLKGRDRAKALLLLIDGEHGPEPWAADVSEEARALMAACWPGPLTLVFAAGPALPPHLADARGAVALRWSPHPCIAELLRLGGAPLVGTSANPSGAPNPHRLEDVLRALPGSAGLAIGLAVDGGEIAPGPPSTLVDTTVQPPRILREGAISPRTLRKVVPGLLRGLPGNPTF